ncbi:MAG: hypothetical protein WA322_20295 [Pseudolabrys sp.]
MTLRHRHLRPTGHGFLFQYQEEFAAEGTCFLTAANSGHVGTAYVV